MSGFHASVFLHDDEKAIEFKNVVQLEHCDNEDGLQVIFWFDNGTGARFPLGEVEKILLFPFAE